MYITITYCSKGVVNILGRVTTIMHKPVQTFEDTVEITVTLPTAGEVARTQIALLEGAASSAWAFIVSISQSKT